MLPSTRQRLCGRGFRWINDTWRNHWYARDLEGIESSIIMMHGIGFFFCLIIFYHYQANERRQMNGLWSTDESSDQLRPICHDKTIRTLKESKCQHIIGIRRVIIFIFFFFFRLPAEHWRQYPCGLIDTVIATGAPSQRRRTMDRFMFQIILI